ncbi:hypothetical protein ACFOWX_06320 [Sphingorhabdus arenilitoris]|uniref:DUF883 family protein n=1 Tax=Sphingorhabdus arenilitoris TaxID=1490041 RepID=A0ABV8RGG7_9SPHN
MSKLSDGIKSAADSAKDGIATAKAKAEQTSAAARKKASDAYGKGREVASKKVQSSKQLATKAKAKSADTIDKNPLAIVAGGLAIGAIIGALLPKTEREQKILGKTGKKLNEKAKQVAGAAKEAGMKKVDDLGINKDTARDQFRDLVSKATEAVKAAGQAASDAARKKD